VLYCGQPSAKASVATKKESNTRSGIQPIETVFRGLRKNRPVTIRAPWLRASKAAVDRSTLAPDTYRLFSAGVAFLLYLIGCKKAIAKKY
jgi:hypothetical protein